eukprot:TRINITY_DN21796_c0_g1_i1.p1 TRINITY_DN21796_c0_g1~~TRINITY_DN21796_c0_g1_i1.p1  ORF type:complete len:122 (+),score=4.09 TRINITY_DN21796_c0_g1_i1:265-630(+)
MAACDRPVEACPWLSSGGRFLGLLLREVLSLVLVKHLVICVAVEAFVHLFSFRAARPDHRQDAAPGTSGKGGKHGVALLQRLLLHLASKSFLDLLLSPDLTPGSRAKHCSRFALQTPAHED